MKELDTRGSHFYLGLYWAQELASQDQDGELKGIFAGIAQSLGEAEAQIIQELSDAQGDAIDIGGYFYPDTNLASEAMRPSATLNAILNNLK